jgi:hypothetical protein
MAQKAINTFLYALVDVCSTVSQLFHSIVATGLHGESGMGVSGKMISKILNQFSSILLPGRLLFISWS